MNFIDQSTFDEGPKSKVIADTYKLLKLKQTQEVLALNFQTLLLTIDGERDLKQETKNEFDNKVWTKAGMYDQKGLFYIREGEHKCIQSHFVWLRLHRQQQKVEEFEAKKKDIGALQMFEPKILQKSKVLADKRKQKILNCTDISKIDVVQYLLYQQQNKKLQAKLKRGNENDDEATPDKTKKVTNGERAEAVIKCHALYNSSKVADKRNKGADEYWYERNAEECTFQPDLVKGDRKMSGRNSHQGTLEVRGTDKAV